MPLLLKMEGKPSVSLEVFFQIHVKSFGKDNKSLWRESLLNPLHRGQALSFAIFLHIPGGHGTTDQVHLVYQIPSKQNWLLSCSYFFVSPENQRIQCHGPYHWTPPGCPGPLLPCFLCWRSRATFRVTTDSSGH